MSAKARETLRSVVSMVREKCTGKNNFGDRRQCERMGVVIKREVEHFTALSKGI